MQAHIWIHVYSYTSPTAFYAHLSCQNAIICVFVCRWHQWRSAAKKKQEEDDFSFAREVRDREKRLQALEEQLEQRARSDCFYSD